jgi:uncharacterized protein (TIGR03437 family)
VVLFASGGGATSPAGRTGTPAPAPHPGLVAPVAITVDGEPAEVLFAGEVPGFIGLAQINARLPALAGIAATQPAPVALRIGSRTGRAAVSIWVRRSPG